MPKKLAYLDCPTGIAGDMFLGALVDAGVPIDYLTAKLGQMGIKEEFALRQETRQHNGQIACKVHVDVRTVDVRTVAHHDSPSHDHHHHDHHDHTHTRCLPEIETMISSAGLPPRVETWSLAIFRQLAQAEGAVHGIPPEQVWFHEVGAIDAIVDIVGTGLGLDWLGIDELHCSSLPTGGGSVWAAHGRLPVPVPAVLKLWEMRQVPVFHNGIDRELVTPTGAAIVTTLAKSFGPPPAMVIHTIGLGAGTIALPIPNIARLWIGEGEGQSVVAHDHAHNHDHDHDHSHHDHGHDHSHDHNHPAGLQTVTVLNTQIDDLSPQAIGYVFDRLFAVGALDVFTQPIGMKKSRPGVLLTVICGAEQVAACEQVMFRETTTLGIRRCEQQRMALDRTFDHVQTEFGNVHIKVAKLGDRVVNAQPEYEDVSAIARAQGLPWREVHQMAIGQWRREKG
jgi:pyridinium-3,5-bisthiocarboxylic acid mononucleotide nickel chelatase